MDPRVKKLLPWVLPPLIAVLLILLFLLAFEVAPPVPFHYTTP